MSPSTTSVQTWAAPVLALPPASPRRTDTVPAFAGPLELRVVATRGPGEGGLAAITVWTDPNVRENTGPDSGPFQDRDPYRMPAPDKLHPLAMRHGGDGVRPASAHRSRGHWFAGGPTMILGAAQHATARGGRIQRIACIAALPLMRYPLTVETDKF